MINESKVHVKKESLKLKKECLESKGSYIRNRGKCPQIHNVNSFRWNKFLIAGQKIATVAMF